MNFVNIVELKLLLFNWEENDLVLINFDVLICIFVGKEKLVFFLN